MKGLNSIFSDELIEALGWTLVHSLWQGAIIAVVLLALLFALRRKSAQIKYFLSFVALASLLIWAVFTFLNAYSYAAEKQELKTLISNKPGAFYSILSHDPEKANSDVAQSSNTINIKTIKTRAFFQRNFYIVCSAWLIGMMVLLARLITGLFYTQKLRTYRLVPLDDIWQKRIHELGVQLGIKRRINAFFSPLASVPQTLGAIKPIILFPLSAFTSLSQKEIEAIIAHELAHIMRHDYLFNIVQSIVEILFFYHPAVWLISKQIRTERENSCDNIAVELIGDKNTYIKTLASIQIRETQQRQLAMTFSAQNGGILYRIQRLQKEIAMKTNFIEGLIAACIIATGLLLASFATGNQTNTHLAAGPDRLLTSEVMNEQTLNRDSLLNVVSEKINGYHAATSNSKELERAVELALSETDEQISAEMLAEINNAIQEINIEKIVREAINEASIALREASIELKMARDEIDFNEISEDMAEARREIEEARREVENEMRRDMKADGIDPEIIDAAVNAALAGIEIASIVVNSIDIENIISSTLNGVSAILNSLASIEIDSVYEEHDIDDDQGSYQKQLRELEREKRKLQREQERIDQRLKALERKMNE
jgi:bla regulator protein blaR1